MKRSYSRRGSIYLVVLATSALVVTMALLGLELARRDLFAAAVTTDNTHARLAAESGADHAIAYMHQSNWRSSIGDGTIANRVKTASGEYSVHIGDTLGDITVPSFNQLKVTSTGVSGNSRVVLEVYAQAASIAPEHFEHVLCAQGNLLFENATVMGTGTIRGGDSSSATASNIAQKVIVKNTVSGATYAGGSSPLLPRTGPTLSAIDWTTVANYYKNIGTTVSSIPSNSIDVQVVGPGFTPWGVKNSSGVYVINCGGNDIVIRDSRIVATLVMLNCKSLRIEGSVSWVPATAGYPLLICNSDISIAHGVAVLSESSHNYNFNPAGVEGTSGIGLTDTDKTDTYQSRLSGLICGGKLLIEGQASIFGIAISSGNVTVKGTPRLLYDSGIQTNPPPGFGTPGEIYLVEHSWQRSSR